ncbi:MAG: SocA family protein [Burkholderiaceae bacterium]|jgi:uncharacterized phage-associated protein|nr:SocA family protein [Burkholderiaceae bacterium]
MIPALFDEQKAAQAAAFLLHRGSGRLSILKLVKLMYLAERESLRRYGDTITGDSFVSMPHGPVLSMTLDHINGAFPPVDGGWSAWVTDRENNEVALSDPSIISDPARDLLVLSDTDVECLDAVWEKFGHMTQWELVAHTHSSECPEWQDPNQSSRPIPPARLLKALGYDSGQIQALIDRLHEQRYIKASFRQAASL